MKALEVRQGDVVTNDHGSTLLVRDVVRPRDPGSLGALVQIKLSEGRTDPGGWYDFSPSMNLQVYRPEV